MLHIARVILNLIDYRLTEHGARVCYIVYKILLAEGKRSRLEMANICLISALHDVGAFKTDEIDDLINFDVTSSKNHCVYGSLFIKLLSPLNKLSDVVLYHHTRYDQLPDKQSDTQDLSALLHLADRIDVLFINKQPFSEHFGEDSLDIKFSRKWYELFEKACASDDIMRTLSNNFDRFISEIADLFSAFDENDIDVFPFLEMVIYSIDFRSPVTAMHTFSTATVAIELAKKLNFTPEQTEKIRYAAMLHDVGKVTTPLSILEKEGKLVGAEIGIMQHHVVATREIISGLVPEEIVNIASRHHEKLNGSGYPDHLVEDQLTSSEKVLVVADIMSALLTKRSYKDVFPKEKIIDIVTKLRDSGCICKYLSSYIINDYDEIIIPVNNKIREYRAIYEQIQQKYEQLIKTL